MPDVCTGTRLVRMSIHKPIPRFISVNGARVKVWFGGQPIFCDICRKAGHRAASCPDKGKCFRCHEVGHLARNCRKPWGPHTGPPAPPPAAEAHPHAGNDAPPVVNAEDLDQGFGPLTGDSSLAEAASVAEAVLMDTTGGEDPVVSGTSEGAPLPLAERFNQLDEPESQSVSQSILLNCGPVAASSGGESACGQNNAGNSSILPNCGPGVASSGGELPNNQIHIASDINGVSENNVSECNVSGINVSENIVSENNVSENNVSENNVSENTVGNGNDGDNEVNYSGSILSLEDAPFGPSDDDMSESSGLKRSIMYVSSDDSSEDDFEEALEASKSAGSKGGPKSKAKKSVGDPSSDNIEEFSSSASSGPQVQKGGSRSAKN